MPQQKGKILWERGLQRCTLNKWGLC